MNQDPNVYEPGRAAQAGERLEELTRRALRLREHLWIATAVWAVPEPGRPEPHLLDRESLLIAPEVGCWVCEERYSPRLETRRCAGEPKIPPGGAR